MRKILFLISMLCIAGPAMADTVNVNWMVDGSVYDTSTCTVGGDLILPTAPTKRGHTFLGWGLYVPLEYIESTGSQWINMRITPISDNVVYEIRWVETALEVRSSLFGAGSGPWTGIPFHPSAGWLYVATASSDGLCNQAGIIAGNINTLKIILQNGVITKIQNGIECRSTYQGSIVNGISMGLFSKNGGAEISRSTRMYYFKMHDHGVLVRDMIPVLDPDGVACMYDRVEGKYYYNAGMGDFIAGPVAQ